MNQNKLKIKQSKFLIKEIGFSSNSGDKMWDVYYALLFLVGKIGVFSFI